MSNLSITHWSALGAILGINFGTISCAIAQVTPDNTLPNNSSVTQQGRTFNITGGTQAGRNLFHSFTEFSVPTGGTASFNNNLDIQNIISRVTGGSGSNIDGLIQTKGTANLFFVNPNGIIFAKNASLKIRGSFVATTASAIQFGNQGVFSATNPESSSSLLSVNPSALLFNQIKTAAIENNSSRGLHVGDGQSLLLVGGDIKMNGGRLFAFGGRAELGGLTGVGVVGLNEDGGNLSLNFADSGERSDVKLSNGARVRVTTTDDGGSIAVHARNFIMTGDNSYLMAGIEYQKGFNNSQAGDIDINATGTINLNNGSLIVNQVLKEANGQAGNVNISTKTLRIQNGGRVVARTYSKGNGGNLTVDAQDIQLIGTKRNLISGLFATAEPNSGGRAGNLRINTRTLRVQDGARVDTRIDNQGNGGNLSIDAQNIRLVGKSASGQLSGLSTTVGGKPKTNANTGNLSIKTHTLQVQNGAQVSVSTYSQGNGGNLSIDAQDIRLIGTSTDGRRSGLFVSARPNSSGNAGDLIIKTHTLQVQDGAQVATGTEGKDNAGNLTVDAQDIRLIGTSADGRPSGLFTTAGEKLTGNAGDLTIKTHTLQVKDGARASASTFSKGKGNGGNLTIYAHDIQLIGTSLNGSSSGIFSSAEKGTQGNAGTIDVNTNTLILNGGAQLVASSFGQGSAGTIKIQASNKLLVNGTNNNSSPTGVFAESTTGQGGNIDLQIGNLLMLRNRSLISAISGVAGSNGLDGNIKIRTKFLVAVPFQNSDIVATGFGRTPGSNIQVNAAGIFGTQFRQQLSSESDIVATGQVTLNTPYVAPINALVKLPTALVNTSALIDSSCSVLDNQTGEFTITGRGGLPPSPNDHLTGEYLWSDTRLTTAVKLQNVSVSRANKPTKTPSAASMIPATNWVFNDQGEVKLVSYLTQEVTYSTSAKQNTCLNSVLSLSR